MAMSDSRKILVIVLAVIFFLAAIIIGIGFLIASGDSANDTGENEIIAPTNSTVGLNTNSDSTNANTASAIDVNSQISVEGTVFLKGYKTPSESYGVLTTDGNEIGLGKYDSMKEQFRPYIGEKVAVEFSNVCRSTNNDCCKTVFFYCGTVISWEPLDQE